MTFDTLNTAEFLAELKARSASAQSLLVEALVSPLQHFVMNDMGIPPADAEDIVFKAFEKVLRSVQRFEHGGTAKLTTWVFQVARNCAVDYQRAKMAEFERNQSLSRALVLPTGHSSNGELVRHDHRFDWLIACLNQLHPADADILRWHAAGFRFSEIGQWMGISEGNTRVRHKRALEKIRALAAKERAAGGAS